MVGYVQGAWGVRGEVRVAPQSEEAAAMLHAKAWELRMPATPGRPRQTVSRKVQARRHGASIIARFEGVDDRDSAAALVGAEIWVPRTAFPGVGQDEYYWIDLIGCGVINRQGEPLGDVLGLIDTGVHSVLRVMRVGQDDSERLIPFVAAYVDDVDLSARRILVDWGLDY